MAKARDKLTDAEWQEEVRKIVGDLREVSKSLEPKPQWWHRPPDDPPPRSTPGAGALPVPREELTPVVRVRR